MDQSLSREDYIENVRLANGRSKPLNLIIEPWSEAYEIPPHDHVIISSRGPIGDGIEITVGDENCIVWGWTGSSMAVVHDSEIAIDVREIKLPPTPIISMRAVGEFLWSGIASTEAGKSADPQSD